MSDIPKPLPYLRKDKPKKDGTCPIYVRFKRIGRVEPKFPLGIDVAPAEWDEVTHRPKDPALKIIMDDRVNDIERQILTALLNKKSITLAMLKNFVKGEEKPESGSFFKYYLNYLDRKFKANSIKDSTYNGYMSTYRALTAFRKEILINEISTNLLQRFDKYLIDNGTGVGGRSNRWKNICSILHDIHRHGIPVDDPFATGEMKVPKAPKNDVFLNAEELAAMVDILWMLEIGAIEHRVWCMYLFSCASGLRLSDALALTWRDFELDEDKMLIKTTMQKTGRPVIVPIFELAVTTLEQSVAEPEKFEALDLDEKVFHQYSGTAINNTVRKLAKMAKVEKHISYNSSRRTFATTLADANVHPNIIKNYMGHANVAMTERYIKYDDLRATLSGKEVGDAFSMKKLTPKV